MPFSQRLFAGERSSRTGPADVGMIEELAVLFPGNSRLPRMERRLPRPFRLAANGAVFRYPVMVAPHVVRLFPAVVISHVVSVVMIAVLVISVVTPTRLANADGNAVSVRRGCGCSKR